MKQIFLKCLLGITLLFCEKVCAAQDYWQQKVNYIMDVDLDVQTHMLKGKQKLAYTNSSPDTLRKVFYHLYWNAFQPNSMMDARSRETNYSVIEDRIAKLPENEQGYVKVHSLKMNGVPVQYKVQETILEVVLNKPVLLGAKVVFEMEFESQVPRLVRRAGRSKGERPNYSMAQWYPKLCEYDKDGWHPTPYVGREFYGVWGDFDVTIHIDSNYVLAGTGYLQTEKQSLKRKPPGKNPNVSSEKKTWRFSATDVHDFMWAASAKYKPIKRRLSNGVDICVYYRDDTALVRTMFEHDIPAKQQWKGDFEKYYANYVQEWERVAEAAEIVFPFIERRFGKYPYKQYSFIAGGDGGMEYPMATLISGPRLGTAFHELMHSWYQGVLATNESKYAWMDEGFANYAAALVGRYYDSVMVARGQAKPQPSDANVHRGAYSRYLGAAKRGFEEPMNTHADHFDNEGTYSIGTYVKGQVFLEQLGYVVGASVRDRILHEYYRVWQFKHPRPDDFIRVAEKVSGMELDWYQEYFVDGIKTIDYGIDSVWAEGIGTQVRLRNFGKMPMPQDVLVTYRDGKQEMVYIPMYLMFGGKPVEDTSVRRTELEAWKWTHPTYTFRLKRNISEIKSIEIDPSQRMADVERKNNKKEFK